MGVRVASAGDAVDLELHLVTEWGASIPTVAAGVERSVRTYLASMVDLDVRTVAVVVDDVAARTRRAMTGGRPPHRRHRVGCAGAVPRRACGGRPAPAATPVSASAGSHDAEDEFGPWGKLYRDETGVIGLIQYGPAQEFPRAQTLPAGPPSRDAVLVTCAYLTDAQSPWVLQSLFLAAIGECRDRGRPALEAFAYRYPSGEDFATRFLGHRTIFPADFLADFGFHGRRSAGTDRAHAARPARDRARARARSGWRGCASGSRPCSAPTPAPVR